MLASNPDVINNLRFKWRGPSFWSPTVGKQGGVARLVRENLYFEVKQWKKQFLWQNCSCVSDFEWFMAKFS